MNPKSTIIVLVAALAVLSGAMGMSMTGVFSDQEIMTASTRNVAVGLMTGHLEIEARHMNGELFDYRQLDNIIVNDGEQCILKMLFSNGTSGAGRGATTTAGAGACTGALTNPWSVIAIGTCTGCAPLDIDVVLGTEIDDSTGQTGASRAIATTKTWANGSSAGAEAQVPGFARGLTNVILSHTFTATAAFGAVTESGLFNSTTYNSNGMLARNTFNAVTINNGDSITITWTFNVGD